MMPVALVDSNGSLLPVDVVSVIYTVTPTLSGHAVNAACFVCFYLHDGNASVRPSVTAGIVSKRLKLS